MSGSELHYEEVKKGSALPSVTKGSITTETMVRWAAGSGDFNPIHYDKGWALSEGLPDVVVAGPMKTAMLAQFIANWTGNAGSLKTLECRYRAMDAPGDTLTLGGRVTEKELTEGQGRVVCEVWIRNQREETTVTGTATLILPVQGG